MNEIAVLLVAPGIIAIAIALLVAGGTLTPRHALLLATCFGAVALTGAIYLLLQPPQNRLNHEAAATLLAIPLATAIAPAGFRALEQSPKWLLLASPVSYFLGLLVALNLGMALGIITP